MAGFPGVGACEQRWRAHAVHDDCQEEEAVKIPLRLSGLCHPPQMCCEELPPWASLGSQGSQDCEVTHDSRAPGTSTPTLLKAGWAVRLDQVPAVESFFRQLQQYAVLHHIKEIKSGQAMRTWGLIATLLYFSLNSLLLLDLLLLDLSSLFKSWASAMQKSTAFPLSACNCSYSFWPKQTAGSNLILNAFIFLKSLCSVETAKGKRYETLVLAGTLTLVHTDSWRQNTSAYIDARG